LKSMKFLLRYCVFILLFFSLSCASSVASQNAGVSAQPTFVVQAETKDEPQEISNLFVREDILSEGDYSVVKLKKKIKIEQAPDLTEVSYAVLKRGSAVLAKFDGVYFGLGNATDFGLFSFLGEKGRQLVVAQTIPRGGRHWIVDLSPDFRVIYDSAHYGVGREELSVLDIDTDGRYEVLQVDTAFYGFGDFSMAETPLPLVIFKYDEKARKYLPANHLFKEYALKDIDTEINQLSSDDNRFISKLVDITLRYIYAGEEQKAWAFFDRVYNKPDKEDFKSKIATVVRNRPTYKFIYGKSRVK
jgi:hypothetical protein